MNDRPSAAELIAASQEFLERELLPTLTDPRLRFQTLVAAHVLGIVGRELATEAGHLAWEWEWLAELIDDTNPAPGRLVDLRQAVVAANIQLCERIRQGEFDEPARMLALVKQLRRTVVRKLQVANPRFLESFGLSA